MYPSLLPSSHFWCFLLFFIILLVTFFHETIYFISWVTNDAFLISIPTSSSQTNPVFLKVEMCHLNKLHFSVFLVKWTVMSPCSSQWDVSSCGWGFRKVLYKGDDSAGWPILPFSPLSSSYLKHRCDGQSHSSHLVAMRQDELVYILRMTKKSRGIQRYLW